MTPRGATLPVGILHADFDGASPCQEPYYRAVFGGTNTRQTVRTMILKSRISDQFSR